MKILKPGRVQAGPSAERVCTGQGNGKGGCGATLLVEEADIYATYASYMGRDEEWFATFKCPCCGVETDIPRADVPPRIWRAIIDAWKHRVSP